MMMNLVATVVDRIHFEQACAYLGKQSSEGRTARNVTLRTWALAFADVNYQFSRQTVHALKLGNLSCP
jgi:hypothetical protein